MKSRQSGFTLVEIAIVLVIIGLLLGGVLKGQELINSAKIKNLVADMNGISTAVYAYQDRFKALPGDDTGATRWTSSFAGTGDTTITGAFDVTFTSPFAAATPESIKFWQHLRLAGFVGGDSATGQPQNAVGGIMGVQWGAGSQLVDAAGNMGLSGLVVCQSKILGRIAESMDNQLDDGKGNYGSVKAWEEPVTGSDLAPSTAAATGNAIPATSFKDDGNTTYTVCKKVT